MNSKKPRITYLIPSSPNPSGYSSDNTYDTINDTTPSYRSIIHIGTYSLSPNQTSSTKQTSRQTSLSPKIQKSISPLITRKPPPIRVIRRLNSIKITRKNTKRNSNNNECHKVPSIIKLMSLTTNNSHTHTTDYFNPSYIEMPYIENDDDVSSSYYDNNDGTNTIQHELALSTPGDSAVSLSSNFNNSNISNTSLYENETLIHGTSDEIDEKIEITNSNHKNIIFQNNKDDIINEQNKIINDLQIQLKNSKNKINILNKKLDNYEDEMHELIDSVNIFADEATTYKKTINILQKQLTNLQRKQYNQFSELSISDKPRRNSKRRSKTESKRRRRSRTWISGHELNVKEMNSIKEYELNDNIYNESDDSFAADWSCALSVLNSDNSNQYKYNQNDLFYD